MRRPHRSLRSRCGLLLLLPLVLVLAAGARGQSRLSFDTLFDPDWSGRRPSGLAWSPDGTRLLYEWMEGEEAALYTLDAASGEHREVLRPSARDADLSLDAYEWTPDGRAVLVTSNDDFHLLALADGTLRRLTADGREKKVPRLSPDGRHVAFVREGDLYLLELDEGRERRLTKDGRPGEILNGQTDWVYWEEIFGRTDEGIWWSPDGARLAYLRFDDRAVPTYPLVDFTPRYPSVEPQRYPKAGETNPTVRIGVLDVESGDTTWLEPGGGQQSYVARVRWLPDGSAVAVQRLSREQDRLELLFCDARTGKSRRVLEERWATWVNVDDDFAILPDGRFVFGSERTGWRHLYLYDARGKLVRELTSGEGSVTSLDAVLPDGRIVFTDFGPGLGGALGRRVRVVDADTGETRMLQDGPGWNGVNVAPHTGNLVHERSDADTPPAYTVRDADWKEIAELPSRPVDLYDPEELPSWEFLTVPAAGGTRLPARMLRPAGLEPDRRHPAIMYHYGCPASQTVFDRWDTRRRDLWHKMMAQRGFVVLIVDNAGSTFFGKHGEDRAHRRFGEGNLAAQVAGVEFLKTLPFVDAQRIGLWGWSGGGSNTLYCVLNRPGVWKAAVAGAPVTDWRLYDTVWTERYLDHPKDNPVGYSLSSPVTYAANLRDALLIVHGTADDNVHPQNTLVMAHELIRAGLPFEDAIYPRQKHGFDTGATRHFLERMTKFFERHLR